MARTYLVFGDIEGRLDVLRVECTKCPRKGRYSIPISRWRQQSVGGADRSELVV
jgi:hypothetical protein